jgi:hypothetical protein
MALHPVGPLPASTYWRRRAVLVAGLLAVVLLLRSCAGRGDDRPVAGTASPHPTATATAPASATPQASARASAVTATRAPAPVPACRDEALALTSTTDQATYALGASPRITLSVKNSSSTACTRDLGSGAVELLVFSGADRIWSSDDCNPSTATAVTALAPGAGQAVVKTWPGKRSRPGCSGSAAPAQAGTYRVVARVGTLRVDGAVFQLHG